MRSTSTAPVPNPAFDRTIALLIEKGYQCGSCFKRDAESSRGLNIPETHFELWVGPKGCVIVQEWKDGNGCDVYVNWAAGHRFDEMGAAL